jgi:hypothetical protein
MVRPTTNKRSSDGSDDSVSSSKMARTTERKRTVVFHQSRHSSQGRRQQVKDSAIAFDTRRNEEVATFKKPTLPIARSMQFVQVPSAQTSFNTSFGSKSVLSSQQSNTEPNTALTSFNSEFGDADPKSPWLKRSSSTTLGGSLDDADLVAIGARLEQELETRPDSTPRENSSTLGSLLDNEAWLEISSKYDQQLVSVPNIQISEELYRPTAKQDAPVNMNKPKNGRVDAQSSNRHLEGQGPIWTGLASPKALPANDSPSRMSYRIRDLPSQNLFVKDVADDLKQHPYFILFICLRLAMGHGIDIHTLLDGIDEMQVMTDPESFWASVNDRASIKPQFAREPKGLWAAIDKAFERWTFKGKVSFNEKGNAPVFKLELLPIEADKSCRFQRAFGSDRFLYLTFPSLEVADKPDRFDRTQMSQIQDKWLLWCQQEHSFLGRKWKAFHVEPVKRGKGSARNAKDASAAASRVVLFATEGVGIEKPYSIGDMLNWFFPFAGNRKQGICKAFARIDLGLSRTVPTLIFKPSQIRHEPDTRADGTPEDDRFNDPELHWAIPEDQPVMDDGCSLISLGAAQEAWRLYKEQTGINDSIPAAFQARIGGAKGLWAVSTEPYSSESSTSRWIEIKESQLKFAPHMEDNFNESYDRLRLTFEIVNYSKSPPPSDLHLSFIPILVDRGVPKDDIADIMEQSMDADRKTILEILPDTVRVYDWVHKEGARTEDSETMRWQAALPLALGDRLNFMLESGFRPIEEPYLGMSLTRFIKQQQVWDEQKLRISLGKTAFLYGIADPFGVLAPGEIHIQFSTWFADKTTDEMYLSLADTDVLVARQPACRRSDIQRVRAVSHPKLGHFVDVVVFPTKGQFPLAGKLQGGDYDGDIFWCCWDMRLVEPFKNAPPPDALDHRDYDIRQNTRKLDQVMNVHDLSTVDQFLNEAIAFRSTPSLLGKVTNYLEKQAYAENSVYSRTLESLSAMHDLLVDAPKQGYIFSDSDFDAVKRQLGLRKPPKVPAYKEAMEACEHAKEMGEADRIRNKHWPHNPDNVIDYLYFRVVRKHNVETLRQVQEVLSTEIQDDAALLYPCNREHEKRNIVITNELRKLHLGFEKVKKQWNTAFGNDGSTTADHYNESVDKCYTMYTALMPENMHAPEIEHWFEPYLSPDFNYWAILRASALYATYPRKAAFVWHMAGRELCELKCPASPTSRRICGPVYSILRPKGNKLRRTADGAVVDDDDDDDDDEDEDEEDSYVTAAE